MDAPARLRFVADKTESTHTSVPTERPDTIWWDDISREAYLIWFWVGVAVITAIVSGLIYRGVREMRILRMAYQYWCNTCRRGTDRGADKSKCLECGRAAGQEGAEPAGPIVR